MKVVFVDTGFWIARFNPNDALHQRASEVATALGAVRLLTSEMVLSEFLAALSPNTLNRPASRRCCVVIDSSGVHYRHTLETLGKAGGGTRKRPALDLELLESSNPIDWNAIPWTPAPPRSAPASKRSATH
jgi:predicted nucleic acid-binding protein